MRTYRIPSASKILLCNVNYNYVALELQHIVIGERSVMFKEGYNETRFFPVHHA